MKKYARRLIVGLSLMSSIFALAGEGDHVGNGGGLAEAQLAFARIRMSDILTEFLASQSSSLATSDQDLVCHIKDAMPLELANVDQLKILNSRDVASDFFFLDGQVRVAKTGDQIGDTIFVNRDLIYTGEGAQSRPIELPLATGIIFHELGHHQGEKNHDHLDTLGATVGNFVDSRTAVLSAVMLPTIDKFGNRVIFEVKSLVSNLGFNRLIIKDKTQAKDLTDSVKPIIRAALNKKGLQLDENQIYFTASWRKRWTQKNNEKEWVKVEQAIEVSLPVPAELKEKLGDLLIFEIGMNLRVSTQTTQIDWDSVQFISND